MIKEYPLQITVSSDENGKISGIFLAVKMANWHFLRVWQKETGYKGFKELREFIEGLKNERN